MLDYIRKTETLLFQSADNSAPLSVTHFHFSAWPDHGVPADKTCLIQFIQRVRKDFPYYDSPPLVVHCSAGVRRSGTFIVLDSMLERMKVEDSLDIYAFICEMRQKRGLMVQTEVRSIKKLYGLHWHSVAGICHHCEHENKTYPGHSDQGP